MKHLISKVSIILLLLLTCNLPLHAIKFEKLTCEFAENPLGVESFNPRFGWVLLSDVKGDKQTAYEIKVASSPDLLKTGEADYWNSGKIVSDKSHYITYEGKNLESGKQYYWIARVWDASGKISEWSRVNTWSVALKKEDWKAKWIGAIHQKDSNLPTNNTYHTLAQKPDWENLWDNVNPLAKRSIILRKEFMLDKNIKDAKIYVSGLGHYDLYINGKRVDNSVFKPLWSEYNKTVYYNVFDISEFLQEGKNTIGVILGNGMYNITGGRYTKFRVSFGPPTLVLQADIAYQNGSNQQVVSDESWKYDFSPITFNCIFGGEDYDATLEQKGWNIAGFDDQNWKAVVLQEAPKGKLTAQYTPSVVITHDYKVKEYKEHEPGTYLFDMGQNLSGFPSIKIQGKKGQKIRLVVGEILNKDKTKVNQSNSGGPYYFEYILKGDGVEEWTPQFSYYGYQYIEIEGIDYLKKKNRKSERPVLLGLTSHFIHSSAVNDGYFHCSNELFNRTHFIIDKATRSNMQSVFTDCPHREKLGWLEETHLNGPGLLFNYDLRNYYPKVMQDIADSQRDNGLIPDIAPEYVQFEGGFVDSPEWGAAGVIIPWMYYEWYGDNSLIKQYYPVMRRYVDYLSTKANDYILSYGLGDWCDYGPRHAGSSQNTPMAITATGHYYMITDLVAKSAAMINNKYDEQNYSDLAKNIANAYNTHLFNADTKQYGSGSQCSNSMPLFLNIVPKEYKKDVINNLLSDIKAKGNRLSTGDVGNRYLYQALAENGLNETMYLIHNHKGVPGYGYQVDYGVTTLTENWDPEQGMSWNHFMMGQIEEWFYKSLAGIKPDIENPGFKHFYIEPKIVGDMAYVDASYNSMYGLIKLNWKIENGKFNININVPVNSTATFKSPVGTQEALTLGSGEHKLSFNL